MRMKNFFGPRLAICLALVLVAALSLFVLAPMAGSVERHSKDIQSIDAKIDSAMTLTASAATASTVISALPDDTATPIANQLAELTDYFLLALCILYTEKYLLTVLGTVVFAFVIPLACGLGIVGVVRGRSGNTCRMALRIALLGLAVYMAIPVGVKLSDRIYETYSITVNDTVADAEALTEDVEAVNSGSGLLSIITDLSGTVKGLINRATDVLKRMLEAVAVMIVTACVIPLLVFAFMIWVIKLFTSPGAALPQRMFWEMPPLRENGRDEP